MAPRTGGDDVQQAVDVPRVHHQWMQDQIAYEQLIELFLIVTSPVQQ
jgi:gamma-glutamyltranspeptidase